MRRPLWIAATALRLLSVALLLMTVVLMTVVVPLASAFAQSTPVNYIGINFSPITTSVSYNYDWSTETLTLGTAAGSVDSTQNALENSVSDPTPPDPNGYGTFIGTARPVQSPTGGGAVLYEQSVCGTGYPSCFSDGTFSYGNMVMYPLRGATLDQLTNLQTDYYVDNGAALSNCFGGGSPRFDIVVSNGTETGSLPEIHVYLGNNPNFDDCPAKNLWTSTGNFATDIAGLRWDTSQVCPGTFYNTYSGAVTCANALGYKINAILVSTDGGWVLANAAPSGNGQTFLFRNIQVNQVTRFPRK
jgi:hypothetical protein